jgi:hypothetical protein
VNIEAPWGSTPQRVAAEWRARRLNVAPAEGSFGMLMAAQSDCLSCHSACIDAKIRSVFRGKGCGSIRRVQEMYQDVTGRNIRCCTPEFIN